ncbi:MAG: MGMT family protein [Candidatus Hodarchaeota archaeon]
MNKKNLSLSEFQKKVYRVCSKIPEGSVTTYGTIARILGNSSMARAVGNALNKNPFPSKEVPCHRVIRSNGEVGGFASGTKNKGTKNKIIMLEKEGIEVIDGRVDLTRFSADIDLLVR